MTVQRHVIQRQTFELAVQSESVARRIQSEISSLHGSSLADVIDRCCSVVSHSGQIDRIASLHVDLGTVDPRDLERELIDRLIDRLPAALAAELGSARGGSGPLLRPDAVAGASLEPGMSLVSPQPASDVGTVAALLDSERSADVEQGQMQASRLVELVAVYARTGTLPWWTDSGHPAVLEDAVRRLLTEAPGAVVVLLRALADAREHLERLVIAFDDELLTEVVSLLAPVAAGGLPPGELAGLLTAIPTLATSSTSQRKRIVWVSLLQAAIEGADLRLADLVQGSVMRVASAAGVATAAVAIGLVEAASVDQATASALGVVAEANEATASDVSPCLRPGDSGTTQQAQNLKDGIGDRTPARMTVKEPPPAAGVVHRSTRRTEAQDAAVTPLGGPPSPAAIDLAFSDSDQVYVDNCGLVMLAPFLANFLARLDLVAEQRFRNTEARHRAVGMLQYLAAGDPMPLEYQVTLSKVLCGLEMAEVFDFGDPVTTGEAEEGTDLLSAVIEHAGVLGDISTSGLQGTFLIRRGVLSTELGTWVLRVERETYDVVLDRLPWSFDWVALPWMTAPLRVEW